VIFPALPLPVRFSSPKCDNLVPPCPTRVSPKLAECYVIVALLRPYLLIPPFFGQRVIFVLRSSPLRKKRFLPFLLPARILSAPPQDPHFSSSPKSSHSSEPSSKLLPQFLPSPHPDHVRCRRTPFFNARIPLSPFPPLVLSMGSALRYYRSLDSFPEAPSRLPGHFFRSSSRDIRPHE